MVHRSNGAAAKDARDKFRKEECASNMGRRRSASTRGAQIMWSMEEYVSNMGQRSNDAAAKDAPNAL